MKEFYAVRYHGYEKRKEYLKSKLIRDCTILEQKEKFILEYIEDKIILKRQKKVEVCAQLKKRGYIPFNDLPKIKDSLPEDKKANKKKV